MNTEFNKKCCSDWAAFFVISFVKYTLFFIFFLTAFLANGQSLYTKAYGNSNNKPVIFIHGGPGSSSRAFEVTTAQKLASQGLYVVLYDRRGEGLSIDKNAPYTFQQTFNDLNAIYKQFNLKKATLVGFSFGGIVATLYAEKYPENIRSLVLVSALLSQPETYKNILERSKVIYLAQNDNTNLNNIAAIEKMNPNSFEYRASCFKHSSRNGFFSTKNQNALAKSLYAQLESDTVYKRLSAHKTDASVLGFWKNENYSGRSIMPVLKRLQYNNVNIYALYGKDDGLFSTAQIKNLQNLIGAGQLKYLENCAHYLYTDQQTEFISSLQQWIK